MRGARFCDLVAMSPDTVIAWVTCRDGIKLVVRAVRNREPVDPGILGAAIARIQTTAASALGRQALFARRALTDIDAAQAHYRSGGDRKTLAPSTINEPLPRPPEGNVRPRFQNELDTAKLSERAIAARRANWKKWRSITPEGRKRLRLAAKRNRPWDYSTGPRTAEGRENASMNAYCGVQDALDMNVARMAREVRRRCRRAGIQTGLAESTSPGAMVDEVLRLVGKSDPERDWTVFFFAFSLLLAMRRADLATERARIRLRQLLGTIRR